MDTELWFFIESTTRLVSIFRYLIVIASFDLLLENHENSFPLIYSKVFIKSIIFVTTKEALPSTYPVKYVACKIKNIPLKLLKRMSQLLLCVYAPTRNPFELAWKHVDRDHMYEALFSVVLQRGFPLPLFNWIVMDSLSCGSFHGHVAMASLSWTGCHGQFFMGRLLWPVCHGQVAMVSLSCAGCYGQFVMGTGDKFLVITLVLMFNPELMRDVTPKIQKNKKNRDRKNVNKILKN